MIRARLTSHTERLGVHAVGQALERYGHAFREQFGHDMGIDGHVELMSDGSSTGRLIALQIKSGPAYFGETHGDAIVFRFSDRHFRYWSQHLLPVVVVLFEPTRSILIWHHVHTGSAVRSGKDWKVHVPLANDFSHRGMESLQRVGTDAQVLGARDGPARALVYRVCTPHGVAGYPLLITNDSREFLVSICDSHITFDSAVGWEENQWLNCEYVLTDRTVALEDRSIIDAVRACYFETDCHVIAYLGLAAGFSRIDLAFGESERYYEVSLELRDSEWHRREFGGDGWRRAAEHEVNLCSHMETLFGPVIALRHDR